jgi:hypothetical protein
LGEKEEEKIFHQSNLSVISSFSEEWIDSVTKSWRFGSAQWDKTERIEMTTLDFW